MGILNSAFELQPQVCGAGIKGIPCPKVRDPEPPSLPAAGGAAGLRAQPGQSPEQFLHP